MDYMRELNAFSDWALINRPSTGAIALWYVLMNINNRIMWKEWFNVPNRTLEALTGLSRQGIDKTRKSLVNYGLIEYQKGTSNQAGKYRMISLLMAECQKVGTGVVTEVGTELLECQKVGTGVVTEVGTELLECQKVGTGVVTEVGRVSKSSTYLHLYNKKDIYTSFDKKRITHQEFIDLYHIVCNKLPKVIKMTEKRKKAIEVRLKDLDYDPDRVKAFLDEVASSSYLTGENKDGWTAGFDWIIKESNFVKILEGNYRDRKGGVKGAGSKEQIDLSEYA